MHYLHEDPCRHPTDKEMPGNCAPTPEGEKGELGLAGA
jgi:hypothetical protein